MSESSQQSSDTLFGERLQRVTGLLAAALTSDQVFEVVLQPALAALGGVAGAVLLLDGDALRVAARQGHDPLSVWCDGPLSDPSPAADALRRREALYFEHSGTLQAAYPELEARTGGVAAVASALLPIVLNERALGVLVLDFREPHDFTPGERHFLTTLAGQCAIALDRVRAFEQERATRQALEASEQRFRLMVQASPIPVAVGTPDGALTLVNDAYLALLDYSRAEFEAGEIDWLRLTPPEERAQDAAMFAAALTQGASPSYLKTMLTRSGQPLRLRVRLLRFQEGQEQRVVGYLEDQTEQLDREQRLKRSNEELEARVLARTAELEAHTAALDAFAAYTEAVGSETDPLLLTQLATAVLRASLAHVSTAYYEREGELWQVRQLSDDVPPELAGQIGAGIPLDAPYFAEAWRVSGPSFVDGFNAEAVGLPGADSFGAVALIPLSQGGEVMGLFTVGTRAARRWQARERALLRAVGRGLSLAMERAEQAQLLARQNSELTARTRALEAFAQLTGDLGVQRDPHALVERAQSVALSLLPPGYALYYQPQGERWCNRVQTGEVGNPGLQAFIDAGPRIGETPTVDGPWTSGEPWYQDSYARGTDTPPELVQHVSTVAALPVRSAGQAVGVLVVALFEARSWTPTDRVVLETVVRSLGTAIERAEGIVALAARTAELERAVSALSAANEELEAFTYSVSHDLMTPVRHVASFAQLAAQGLGDPSEAGQAKTRRYLDIVGQGAQRMNTLIEAMLQLSRTGRRELRLGLVDLGALVTQAQQDLSAHSQDRQIEWEVGPLPLVQGDRDSLSQAVDALLNNAVKFTRPREQARVRVWAEEGEQTWTLCVQDNGVGFDPRYQEKLFGIFQRLHRADEFEGVGVGLANVRRIVTRHGGQVQAQGEPGVGATFCFSLPKRE